MSGPMAFAAEVDARRERWAIAGAFRDAASCLLAADVRYESPLAVVETLTRLNVERDPVAVVVDPRSHAATVIPALKAEGIVATEPSARDVSVAYGEFMDLLNGRRLRLVPDPGLDTAARAAQTRPLAGGHALERRVPGADESPLVAAVLAVWAFSRWEELSKPGVWVV